MVDMSTGIYNPAMKNRILETAGRLFAIQKPSTLSMTEIALASGIDEEMLYMHFEDKRQLLQVFIAEMHIQLSSAFFRLRSADNAIVELQRSTGVTLEIFQSLHPAMLLEIESDYPEIWRKIEALRDHVFFDFILANLKRGRIEGLYRQDLDLDFAAWNRLQDLMQLHNLAERNLSLLDHELNILTQKYLQEILSPLGQEELQPMLEQVA